MLSPHLAHPGAKFLRTITVNPMSNEYLGKDILFDEDGDLKVSATGDLETVTGLECLKQDLRDRLETMPGDLYAHLDWGCRIRLLLGALSTPLNRALAVRYLRLAVLDEPRIRKETVQVLVRQFTVEQKVFEIRFVPKGFATQQSLVWGFGLTQLPVEV